MTKLTYGKIYVGSEISRSITEISHDLIISQENMVRYKVWKSQFEKTFSEI